MQGNNNDLCGLIVADKPAGITSFKLISIIKKILKVKKIGHCGTLDPAASGLMLVLTGKATKRQSEFMKQDKVYRAAIKLGIKTDTGDMEGKIISQSGFSYVTLDKIKEVCKKFTGTIEQVPPMYSALKVNGQKLYDLARKGITIERKKRQVTIYSIEIISFENGIINMSVKCSSGTYIRTLAEDIGSALNTDAALCGLVREQIGSFTLSQAVTLKDIENKKESVVVQL